MYLLSVIVPGIYSRCSANIVEWMNKPKHGIVARSSGSRTRLLVFKTQLCHLLSCDLGQFPDPRFAHLYNGNRIVPTMWNCKFEWANAFKAVQRLAKKCLAYIGYYYFKALTLQFYFYLLKRRTSERLFWLWAKIYIWLCSSLCSFNSKKLETI